MPVIGICNGSSINNVWTTMIANHIWNLVNVALTSFGLKLEENSKVYGAWRSAVSCYIYRFQRGIKSAFKPVVFYKGNVNSSSKIYRAWDLHLEHFSLKKWYGNDRYLFLADLNMKFSSNQFCLHCSLLS